MKAAQAWPMAKQAAQSWIDDYAPSMGAALAYYALFSIAPLILIVVSIAGLVFGADAARGQILDELRGLMGEQGASAVQSLLQSVSRPREGFIGTAIGVTVLLVGATGVFGELQSALDRIWRAPALVKRSGLVSLLRSRLLSFGMVLCIGFLLIVSLVASAAISAIGHWWQPVFGGWELVAQGATFALGFAFVTVMFAMIYKLMPRASIRWHDVWIGAAFTSLLFNAGKVLIGLYLGKSGLTSGFGAAGSLVALLFWMYYSSQIFLLGAEFTWVYTYTCGSRQGTARPGAAAPHTAGDTGALERSRAAIVGAMRRMSRHD
ncbi:MAG: YihY/virulence factor BrkB family protein [Caldimonas sp.]|nr:YihY/virulence factor BrkB family protein [Pseudomonadota bacterium]